ncbi:MAG: nuclear transport factor 2 family protein [Pseudomonadota bacterium]
MPPSDQDRDALFKAFGRAFFKQDLDALYEVVTEDFTYCIQIGDTPRVMNSRARVAAFFEDRKSLQRDLRFEDVVYHHAPEATFMTYRVTGVEVPTDTPFERIGVERYTFRNGKIAEKDVYSRPMLAAAA